MNVKTYLNDLIQQSLSFLGIVAAYIIGYYVAVLYSGEPPISTLSRESIFVFALVYIFLGGFIRKYVTKEIQKLL